MQSSPESPPNLSADKTPRQSCEVRRAQIIEAAFRLFSQNGFQGTTTKEIAAETGINEALIFRYFHSKQELYSAILDYGSNQASSALWLVELSSASEQRDDEALFYGIAQRLVGDYELKRQFIRLILYSGLERHELSRMCRERHRAPLEKFLEDYISLRQREGAFGGVDARAAALGFIGMCSHHAMLHVLFGPEWRGITDEQAEAAFTRVFLDGLRCTRGRASAQPGIEQSLSSKEKVR